MPEDQSSAIAVAVVIWREHVLVGQRGAEQTLAGMAEFPGGKCHVGEAAEAAAVRECHEETGLSVVVESEYPDVRHTYRHGQLHLRFFRCGLSRDTEAVPREPFEWVPISRVRQLKFPPANTQILNILAGEDR